MARKVKTDPLADLKKEYSELRGKALSRLKSLNRTDITQTLTAITEIMPELRTIKKLKDDVKADELEPVLKKAVRDLTEFVEADITKRVYDKAIEDMSKRGQNMINFMWKNFGFMSFEEAYTMSDMLNDIMANSGGKAIGSPEMIKMLSAAKGAGVNLVDLAHDLKSDAAETRRYARSMLTQAANYYHKNLSGADLSAVTLGPDSEVTQNAGKQLLSFKRAMRSLN